MKVRRRLGLGALIGFPLATYVGYPALVWAASILRPRPFVTDPTYGPPVTFVIAAHNEAALIGAKVRNILDLDYPPDRIDCIVACDGCDDGTAGEARRAGNDRLQVIELPRQRGKLAAIRAAVPHARGEIIALTDANAMLEQDALSHLVAPFADSTVAVVSGAKQVCDGPEAAYWRYERWIRARESASGSVAGADGALYAVRAAAVDTSARAGAADDLLISLRAAQTAGRIVFAPEAHTLELPTPDAHNGPSRPERARYPARSSHSKVCPDCCGLRAATSGGSWPATSCCALRRRRSWRPGLSRWPYQGDARLSGHGRQWQLSASPRRCWRPEPAADTAAHGNWRATCCWPTWRRSPAWRDSSRDGQLMPGHRHARRRRWNP